MSVQQELQFVEYKEKCYVGMCQKLSSRGCIHVLLRPFNRFAANMVRKLMRIEELRKGIVFYAIKEECDVSLVDGVRALSNDREIDAILLFGDDGKEISTMLMDYLDERKVVIVAPITKYYYKKTPLFLISIPKSGTHLLYKLVESFGYKRGVVLQTPLIPGTWYCLEYSNSHTPAKSFFIERVHRSPFGMNDHPFLRSPAIFIYRNPLDILVSEANYYNRDGKSPFAGYLSRYNFDERLLKLINDPWLLGSIRDRIGNFIPWLDFQNVIPVSFEELIGPHGGGNIETQSKLIWSLQLKLHIPGKPEKFSSCIFSKESATFHEGQIGTHRRQFNASAYEKFYSLPQDFMELLGFDSKANDTLIDTPSRSEEFRKRHVMYSEADFDNTPISVVINYYGYNIVKYQGLYYGVSQKVGSVDMGKLKDADLARFFCEKDVDSVKRRIPMYTKLFYITVQFAKRYLKRE